METGLTTWQCAACDEQHELQFAACWNCGTDQDGVRDEDFQVCESASAHDQSLVAEDEGAYLPAHLPTLTYFCIPPIIWLSLLTHFGFPPSAVRAGHTDELRFVAELLLFGLEATVIVLPVFYTITRVLVLSVVRRRRLPTRLPEAMWILWMFRLPAKLSQRFRWFAPCYYGSILALFLLPLGILAWQRVSSS